MPDDSSAAQRASQQAHASRIRFERHLMRLTGLPRTQVRQRLRAAQAGFVNETLRRVVTPPQERPSTFPKVVSETGSVAPNLQTGGPKGGGDISGNTASTSVIVDAIVLRDGILRYADLGGVLKGLV